MSAVQLELWCVDCPEPAFPGDIRCAIHSWNHDAIEAFDAIKKEIAEDAGRAEDDQRFDGGAV